MCRSMCLIVLCLLGVSWGITTTPVHGAERPVYKTPEELREACKSFLVKRDFVPKSSWPRDKGHRDFILGYLGSKDAKMRCEALDILVKLHRMNRSIRASAYETYLAREYPISVRVVALACSLEGHIGANESFPQLRWGEPSPVWKRMRKTYVMTINDIAECPVTPRNFLFLVRGLRIANIDGVHGKTEVLLEPANRVIFVRRLLAYLSGVRDSTRQEWILSEIYWRFSKESRDKEVENWYAVEPNPAVRKAFIDGLFDGEPHDEAYEMIPILTLASKDTEQEVADAAKRLLVSIKVRGLYAPAGDNGKKEEPFK
jgi:hypothetical protein